MVKAARPRPRTRAPVAKEDSSRPAPVRPRIGRPTVDDKRKKAIRVLTTEDEHAELKHAAASVSMSVSTWMRSVALERARQMAKKARQEERSRQDGEQGQGQQGQHGDDSGSD